MKKISKSAILLALLIDFLVLRSADSLGSVFNELGKKKLGLLFLCNVIFCVALFTGDRIGETIKKWHICKFMEWLFLILTPPVLLGAVQLISSFCLDTDPAHGSLAGALERMQWIEQGYILKNLLIGYGLLLLLILLLRKVRIACGMYSFLLIMITLVNFYVVQFRGQPFMLLDILGMGTAADVAGGYKFQLPVYIGIVLLLVMTYVCIQWKIQTLELGTKSTKNLALRLGTFAAVLLFLVVTVPKWWSSLEVSLWNVSKEYVKKGYLYMLAGEGKYFSVEKPADYSIEKVDSITEEAEKKYTASADSGNVTQPENIIMIMNESLADFESVGEISTDSEILPFIHSLKQNVKYGQLHVPTYGGGTARTEYEALTGNAMYFLPAGSVPYQLYVRDPEYGMADILKAQGYETLAMHPNRAANWNREKVYPSMGFDQFISKENWGDLYRDKIRSHESDKSTYDKIINIYEEKEKNQKLFTFCVTMQNHGGYGAETRNGYEPTVKLNYKKEYPQAETYLSLARESDSAFKDLLDYFEKAEEPTMIIMFGDHWPAIEDDFLSKVIGKDTGDLSLTESQTLYTTPYVIWTNYPSETKEQDISSNYLGSYILELAGAELSQYNKFLLNLKEELPVIGIDAVEDKDGHWYSSDDMPENYQKLIEDYNILQYNDQFEKKDIKESAFRVTEQ